jgi:hypothetical protein
MSKRPRDIPDEIYEAASAYVDKQLATMAKYGDAPTLSEAQKAALVQQVALIVVKATEA